MKVLFIAGGDRSGSTILATLLGQFESFAPVGEMVTLWRRGLLENRHCSCELRFRECGFWRKAMEPYLSVSQADIEHMVTLAKGLYTIPVFRRCFGGDWAGLKRDTREYATIAGSIYQNIQESTGCSVIVDSSKYPLLGYAAGLIPNVQLYVLHLVRDARAVAYSWQRHKLQTPFEAGHDPMPRIRTKRSALRWLAGNALGEFFWGWPRNNSRYMLLRYEDFVRQPRQTLLRICDMLGEGGQREFFLDDKTARIDRPTHQVWGNPSRFQRDLVRIRPDREWSSAMSSKDKRMTIMITWPLLLRYGYLGRVYEQPPRRGSDG